MCGPWRCRQGSINPCAHDIVVTATAEALAMGKWVLLPAAPCCALFSSFSSCLIYRNGDNELLDLALLEERAGTGMGGRGAVRRS